MRRSGMLAVWYLSLSALVLAADTLFVQVREAPLKEKPSAFSKVVAKLPEGTPVETGKSSGTWVEVTAPDRTSGWIAARSLAESRAATISTEGPTTPAATSDVYMAGRTLNEEVEREYRKSHADVARAFADVDAMERSPVFGDPMNDLETFRREGRLGEFAPKDKEGRK